MILVNQFLQVEIAEKGAELTSLKRNDDGYEYLWHADPKYWGKTSPVLFPIVGALKGGAYRYDGATYKLPRHGFARDLVFAGTRISDTEALFTLADTEETRTVYPFAFRLAIRYRLDLHALCCTYEVHNPSERDPLLFAIGAHPAFAAGRGQGAPDYEAHYLEFPDDDRLICHRLDGDLLSTETYAIELANHRLPLRYSLFESDALVMKALRSREVSLRNSENGRGIRLRHDDFPFFGIWAAKGADFVCLEPWFGIADSTSHDQRLEHKEGIQHLDAGQTWAREWMIQAD